MKYLVSELFDLVEKEPTKEGKIKLLRDNGVLVVKSILHMNFDPTVKFLLPDGEPPFKKETDKPMGYQTTTLILELRRFYIWFQPDVNINQLKRESLFIQMLEGLHYTEAEIICLIKDRKLEQKYPSITHELVMEAYPGLLPAPLPKPEPEKVVKKSRTKKSLQQSAVM
jgi:hypothetical protein